MQTEFIHTEAYRELMKKHITETLSLLLKEEQYFAVACETRYVEFDPKLPEEIYNTFQEAVVFILENYTFQSATLDREALYFEAGFGVQNFGSRVQVPLLAIKQIFVGENPILINFAHPEPKLTLHTRTPNINPETIDESDPSMQALLQNPENLKLLKKKKRSD